MADLNSEVEDQGLNVALFAVQLLLLHVGQVALADARVTEPLSLFLDLVAERALGVEEHVSVRFVQSRFETVAADDEPELGVAAEGPEAALRLVLHVLFAIERLQHLALRALHCSVLETP